MNVSSVGITSSPSVLALQKQPEAAEVQKAGRDNDGDSDDGGASKAVQAPAPTVNLNGQKVGQIINVSA
jgi:hypothetical protein